MVATGATLDVERVQRLGQRRERRIVVETALYEAETFGQPVPDLLAERGAGVFFDGLVDDLTEVFVGPVPAGEPDQRERRRQQAPIGEVVDRRHQFLAGQVTGDAEDHHPARPGDARHPLVPLVPQRVVPAGRHRR